MEGDTAHDPSSAATAGEKLRAAREAQKLELSEVASRTRIPQRHLEAVEQSNFSGLPSVTYALGFAKAYARAVGLDEAAIARQLRSELGTTPERTVPVPTYDLDESARVPPRGLAWAGAIVALLVLIGVALWYGTGLFRGSPPPADPLASVENTTAPDTGNTIAVPAPAPAAGQVTLVATDTVWLRVTDASGNRLLEKELKAGERYDVPASADRPRVRTGRPDRVQVLVNGSAVAPLGSGVETVETEVTAAALQARSQPAAAAPTPGPAAATPPRPRPTPRPTAATTPPAAPVDAPAGNAAANP